MRILAVGIFGGLVLISVLFGIEEDKRLSTLEIHAASNPEGVVGLMPRVEREFKIGISGASQTRTKQINEAVYQAVLRSLESKDIWQAPAVTQTKYYLTLSEELFIFRDLYFDSHELDLTKNNASIRLRYRWDSEFSYRDFLRGRHSPEARPTRIEIQSKTDRTVGQNGYSEVFESRMWFERDAPPIQSYFEMGKAQLLLPLLIQTVKRGSFDDKRIAPNMAIAQFLRKLDPTVERIRLEPKAVVVTKRYRMHVNLVNPWGSGPNPTNTFIVTIDRFSGQRTHPDLKLERHLSTLAKTLSQNEFTEQLEVEVEFEHNTSTRLDDEIKSMNAMGRIQDEQRLLDVRAKFLQDQARLAQVVRKSLEEIGLKTFPVSESKYLSIFNGRNN